jgi:predicted nucleic acid-binding protein
MRVATSRGRSGARQEDELTRAVIDASVAMKWVIEEDGTADALALRDLFDKLLAPDLLVAECANVLWKKVARGEVLPQEARIMAQLLSAAEIELIETRAFLEPASWMAIELDHPAYDCMYMALATELECAFITADAAFVQKVRTKGPLEWQKSVLLLSEGAKTKSGESQPN